MPTESEILNSLNLGTSRESLSNDPKSPLSQLLSLQVQNVVDDLRASLDTHNADASGNLKQSIVPTTVKVEGNEVSVEIQAPFYWKFVNFGVNGTLINRGAPNWGKQEGEDSSWQAFEKEISDWIVNRGIQKPAQFDTYKSFNYVIRKNKREKGQIARPFFSDVVNEALIQELQIPITKLMKRAITIKIIEPWQ
tara:strand:+ start:321 stop:902 length:582 start_codon:yes stop_codon:yes gene_type:complete